MTVAESKQKTRTASTISRVHQSAKIAGMTHKEFADTALLRFCDYIEDLEAKVAEAERRAK